MAKIEIEKMKEEIDKVFTQFRDEELGNRLSQFALMSLLSSVKMIIDKFSK
jgi:hypothetical protein